MEFARALLLNGRRDAARELNKAVSRYGKNLKSNSIILEIAEKFDVTNMVQSVNLSKDGEPDDSNSENWGNDREIETEYQTTASTNADGNVIGINTRLVIGSVIVGFVIHLMNGEFEAAVDSAGEALGIAFAVFIGTYLLAALPLMIFNKSNAEDKILTWCFCIWSALLIMTAA